MATDAGWGEANRHRLSLSKEATGFELAKPFSNKKLCKKKLQEFGIGRSVWTH